jgi:hypothetical protein
MPTPARPAALLALALACSPALAQLPPSGGGLLGPAPAARPSAPPPPPAAPAVPPRAAASPLIETLEVDDAVEIMREAGYRGTVSTRRERSIDIETRTSGLRSYFVLYNCDNGTRCGSAGMRMTAQLDVFGLDPARRQDVEAALVASSRWADYRRYTTSNVTRSERDGQPLLIFSSDMSFEGGVTRANIAAFITRFDELLSEYRAFMRDPANRRMPGYSE